MCVDDLGVSRLHSPIYCTVGAATTPQILTSLLECLSAQVLSQCEHENGDLRESVERLRGALEEQREENTELVSKVTAQAAELHTLQNSCTDLQSRLNMAELLTQQVREFGSVLCAVHDSIFVLSLPALRRCSPLPLLLLLHLTASRAAGEAGEGPR